MRTIYERQCLVVHAHRFWVDLAILGPRVLIAQGQWAAPAAVRQFLNGPLNLAGWGPLIAAVFVTWRYEGLAGLKVLLKRGIAVRLGGIGIW